MLKSFLTAIADALRNFLGTTDRINAQDFPQTITEIYNIGDMDGHARGYLEGEKAEYDRFWDTYQENGKRVQYEHAFADWREESFTPKYDMILELGNTGAYMFWRCRATNIVDIFEKQGVVLDTTKCGDMQSMFHNAYSVKIPEINCTHAHDYNSNGLYYTFCASKAETIDKLIVTEHLKYVYAFLSNKSLKNIVFEGVIGENIAFPSSPLSKDSIISIINHLSETASGKTLSLLKTAVNTAFGINVDDETTYPEGSEYYALRHSKDNWTFSYV